MLLIISLVTYTSSMANCGAIIGHVPAKPFCQGGVAIIVDLTQCGIETVDKDAFRCLPRNVRIRLDDNRLTSLPAGLFRDLDIRELNIRCKHDNNACS